jgi:hypothetical protein
MPCHIIDRLTKDTAFRCLCIRKERQAFTQRGKIRQGCPSAGGFFNVVDVSAEPPAPVSNNPPPFTA